MKDGDFEDLKQSLKDIKNFQEGKLKLEPIKRKTPIKSPTLEELLKSVPKDYQPRENEGWSEEDIKDSWIDDMPERKSFWDGDYDDEV